MFGKKKMFKTANKHLLLVLVLVFAFAYRMLLLQWAIYPPGADIGLHESVVNSITSQGNTDLMWNNYQMGGGLSLTFPGYHIFVSNIILITGIPDYLAHSLVTSFFSSLIVLCAFLIGRSVWGESTGFTVAFLIAISRFDVEMLMWGGFPNTVTLLLIPLVFYLYLERDRFSMVPFLVTTTILSGAIFLTHSLSAIMFVCITFSTVIFATVFSKRLSVSKKHILLWLLPIFLGAVLVSPFLLEAAPAYLGANSETFTGGVSGIRLALLSTRVLPLEWVIPLFASVVFFFLFSKKYLGKFLTVPALLLTLWIFIPMLFTQAYLVRIYTDYNRFLYFIILPLILLIALGIDHGAGFFARITDTYLMLTKKMSQTKKKVSAIRYRLMPNLSRKNIYAGFMLSFLLISFSAVPIFLTPFRGVEIQSFYQTMNEPRYEAIQWARYNTPVGSVFVSDALYGWWFSGFAERPTLSAVDPQYLALAREFEPAKIAKNLLDTNYVIDNELIQVREDGGYVGRHNPVIIAKLNWTYFPYAFFNFNNSETEIRYRVGDELKSLGLDQLPVKEMLSKNDTEQATIVVKKGNEFFNYTQLTTVYKGLRFVNMSITLENIVNGVSLDWLDFTVSSKGKVLTLQNRTVALLDEGVKAFGQLIFDKEQPNVKLINPENPCIFELDYNLQGKAKVDIQISLTAYSVTDDLQFYQDPETTANYFNKIITENLNSSQTPISEVILDVFNYQKAVCDWNISYIACRDSEIIPKFAGDPAFSLVFINNDVAIFMIKKPFA
ncbi:hypothetical protein E2P60_04415 [Candidatus Bathyarchaeota archaeon]|nr:hypothetical protein E2P60_04415 [Candidatus Bathyarchaeota archaeon]